MVLDRSSDRCKPGTREPTPESAAALEEIKDLGRRYADVALRRFVADDDLHVRRYLLPSLDLSPEGYDVDLQPLVAEAVRIARTSDDEYLRLRVENQVPFSESRAKGVPWPPG